jgi:hypothetical protein
VAVVLDIANAPDAHATSYEARVGWFISLLGAVGCIGIAQLPTEFVGSGSVGRGNSTAGNPAKVGERFDVPGAAHQDGCKHHAPRLGHASHEELRLSVHRDGVPFL